METKFRRLKAILDGFGQVLIAFSGGVDSTFLLKVARETLGKENVLAVTAHSIIRFEEQINKAGELAHSMDVRHLMIESSEFENENFKKNNELRCYYCKYELYKMLTNIADREEIDYILDGTNQDDIKRSDRPGHRALDEFDIKTPLAEANLNKEEIRKLSKKLGLSTWDKPSDTCLATRITYDLSLNKQRLNKIRDIELFLRNYDFKQLRVRLHDENTVRLEVLPDEMSKIMHRRKEVVKKIRSEGFNYITLDMVGYRSGSMIEIKEEKGE